MIQYLNILNNSNSKKDIVTKNMKIAFFNNINDLVLNKIDELKYLVLYLDEKNKKKIIGKYFNIWKNTFLSAVNTKNIKQYEIENNNINFINRNKSTNNHIFKIKEQEHFSIEENLDEKSLIKEKLLKEMKKYIIDFDEDVSNKENQKNLEKEGLVKHYNKKEIIEEEKQNIEQNIIFNIDNNISRNNNIKNISDKKNMRAKTDDDEDKMEKYRKKFKELEEEYRMKYLLSSKSSINDNEAQNLINIKESINKAINNAKDNIHKIDEFEKNYKINYQKKIEETKDANINFIIFDSLEKVNENKINNINKDSEEKKYFINNDLKIEKVNTKVINNFNIKLENLSHKGKRNIQDKLYSVTNVNEFSFAPKSSSHHNDKNNNILNKRNNHNINENKKTENIMSLKDLNVSNESDNNLEIYKKLNNIIFDERLINEEMIQKFLKNKKNEGIFKNYKNKNSISNKTINSYNYKNKYLGCTLGGIRKKRQVKSSNNILKSENSLDININKYDEEIINKSNATSLKKDNSNFITINKINNMLEEMFDEEKRKKLKINISETENNSVKINNKNEIIKDNNNRQKTNNESKKIKRNHIPNANHYQNFNKANYKINKKKLFKKAQEPKNFKVNIKGNDKKYILNSYKNTGNNISKNSSNITNKNILNSNIPLSTMTFNERLDFFKNKKGLDIQKIKSNLINKESNIYTFCPKTNKTFDNKVYEKRSKSSGNVINFENQKDKTKTKINYEYLNGLYLDYKKRNLRLKKLREENDKEDGISFNPFLYKNSRWDKSDKKSY